MKYKASRILLVIIIPLVLGLYFSSAISLGLAIFTTIVILWFSELIPLAATGLLVPVLATTYGQLSVEQAFAPFGNQILFLFVGSFILAKAMIKHRWDQRMAFFILSRPISGKSIGSLCLVISLLGFVLSMWISNTAACAIIVPISVGLIQTLREKFENKDDFKRFKVRLLLTCAFSSSIGGLATPIGSPPNLLAIEFLKGKGIIIDFLDWIMIGAPIALVMLLLLNLIFSIRLPVKNDRLEGMHYYFKKQLDQLGRVSRQEIQVAFAFSLAVILWILPSLLKNLLPGEKWVVDLYQAIPMGIVALIAALSLFIMFYKKEGKWVSNISWKDAASIDWGTILLFGGGLCMGTILNTSGLAKLFGSLAFSWTDAHTPFYLITFVSVTFAIIMSEMSSNTASASIVIPILLAILTGFGPIELHHIIIATAFGASFGFMLPVSTPPNAIVFGTGHIKLRDMITNGIIFDLTGLVAITCYVFFRLKVFY